MHYLQTENAHVYNQNLIPRKEYYNRLRVSGETNSKDLYTFVELPIFMSGVQLSCKFLSLQ